MANDTKKGLNTNSNTYTIIYSAIMVIIVAFLLANIMRWCSAMSSSMMTE